MANPAQKDTPPVLAETPAERRLKGIRVAGLSVMAFFLMLSYSIARPAVESLFLKVHTYRGLPAVWMVVAAGALATVWVYNRFVARVELMRFFCAASLVSAGLLVVLMAGRAVSVPYIHHALYTWKDIYMVVLVEIYYTYGNSVFPIQTARWVYGLFGVCAAAGGITGNLAVGPLAQRFSTANTLYLVPLILVLLAVGSYIMGRHVGARAAVDSPPRFSEALKVVRRSRYLICVLALIALVQISITLIDYQFNIIVERAYPSTDIRTGIIGKVYAAVNFGTVTLHSLTGPLLRLFGVPLTLAAIPFLLGAGLGLFVAIPVFMMMATVKVTSKVFDYSIFRAAKEILYIPLSSAHKTMGKSVIDILTYRVAKAGASLLMMGIVALGLSHLITGFTFITMIAWFAVTVLVIRNFRAKVSRAEEMGPARTSGA